MREIRQPQKSAPQRPAAIQEDFTSGRTWSVSFRLLDTSKKWSLIDSLNMDWNLSGWLIRLNRDFDLKELTNISVGNLGGSAHHWVSFETLNPEALSRIRKLQSEEIYFETVEDRLFSMRYCYKPNSTERLICTIYDYVIYPIWWDAYHEVYGAEYEKQTSSSCELAFCHH